MAASQPGFLGELLILTGPLSEDDDLTIAGFFSDKWYYNY